MASMNDLADEMILQMILSWLPVLSLFRCKLVCRSWRSIISSPNFIQAHLAISQRKQHPFSTLRTVLKNDETQDFFLDTLGEDSVKLPLPRYITDVPQLLIRSCNGLITLGSVGLLYIWNPLIRMGKLLPRARYCLNLEIGNNLGFGYDSLSNDYKILRVAFGRFTSFLSGKEEEGTVAELYSLNADSWRVIPVPEEMHGFKLEPMSKCVCVDSRVLCFRGTDGILSFDLHDEVFGMHKYPDSGKRISEVLDFEGSIALVFRSVESGSFKLSLWALNEVDGKLSWTQKFNVEPAMRIAFVHLYLGDGKFIARDHSRACFFYDVKKGTFVQFRRYMSVVEFRGSLLSLEGFERRE